MLEPARIPITKVRNNVIVSAAICAAFYIVFLLIMQAANLLQVTGFRVVNYFVLFGVCFALIRRWVFRSEHFVPFLTVFVTCLGVGVLSFVFFCIFLLVYGQLNPQLTDLFNQHAPDSLRSIPAIIILFEGTAASIVVAFINMQYFRRYEEGEASAERKHHHSHSTHRSHR